MREFLEQERIFRGIGREEAQAVPPFGGPIYAAATAEPTACNGAEGVDRDGGMHWTGGPARYLYILTVETDNPGVPPNRDLPAGTRYRLDVRADSPAVDSGVSCLAPPTGAKQRFPEVGGPELQEGTQYRIYALKDVGLPLTHCVFTYGDAVEPVATPVEDNRDGDEGPPAEGGCDDNAGFGQACQSDADYSCEAAPFCAIMPGLSQGLCTATGCVESPEVCPEAWTCFDLSFAGQPSICIE